MPSLDDMTWEERFHAAFLALLHMQARAQRAEMGLAKPEENVSLRELLEQAEREGRIRMLTGQQKARSRTKIMRGLGSSR